VFGDDQVPNIATETEAQTLGLSAYTPELTPGRSPDVVPFWGVSAIRHFPYPVTALVQGSIILKRTSSPGTHIDDLCQSLTLSYNK